MKMRRNEVIDES